MLVILATVLALEGAFLAAVRLYYYGTAEKSLAGRVAVSADLSGRYLPSRSMAEKAHAIIDGLDEPQLRVEVLDRSGRVVLNSDGFGEGVGAAAPADASSASPASTVAPTSPLAPAPVPSDAQAALLGTTATWTGRSPETGELLVAAASPLYDGTRLVGALRFVGSAEAIHRSVVLVTWGALGVGLAVVLAAFALAMLLARGIVRPVEELTGVAAQLAGGHYDVRAVRRGDDEIGRLADTLNRMSAEIMKSDQVKKDFLSNISHELRTPLTAIKGWTETILAGPPGDRLETRQGLEVIDHETNRLIGLVEELLDFSRLQSGRVTLDLRPVDVGRLVDEVVRQFAARAREGGLELRAEVPGGGPAEGLRCMADEDRLRQVLINLVDNAVKFTGPGGMVRVEVRPEADGPTSARGLTIAVSDTGCGISPDDLPRVTAKFYKADNKKAGSGLGLPIVDEIVRLHGGRVSLESEPGRGTTVAAWLPMQPANWVIG